MRAPVLHGHRSIAYEEVPDPIPGPGEVLLAVGLCGVCGSDLHLYDSPLAPDGIVMGHEFGAVVRALGKGVEGWRAGDRVVVAVPPPCMNCTFCRRAEYDFCYQHYRLEAMRSGGQSAADASLGAGGYGPLATAAASRLLRIPDEIDDRQAACIEPAAVAFRAVRRSGLSFGDRVAVLGAGPIGLFVLQCALAAGATRVVAVEPLAGRASVALELGATAVVDPRQGVGSASPIAAALGGPPDVVFDAAGVPRTLEDAVELVRVEGRVMMVGVAFEPAPVRPSTWILKRVTVGASFAYSRGDYEATIELIAQGRVRVEPMVSAVIPARDTSAVFEQLLGATDHVKVLLDPKTP